MQSVHSEHTEVFHYGVHAQRWLSNWFCPSVSFVSSVKKFEISTFTELNNCCTRRINNVCVPDREQSGSLLCISRVDLGYVFYVVIVVLSTHLEAIWQFITLNWLQEEWVKG